MSTAPPDYADVIKRLEQLAADNRRLQKKLWIVGFLAGLALFVIVVEQTCQFPLFGYPWKYRNVRTSESVDASRIDFYPPSSQGDCAHGDILARREYMWLQFEKQNKAMILTVDEQRALIELRATGSKEPPRVASTLRLGSIANGSLISFSDSNGKVRLTLGIIDDQPAIVSYDAQGNAGASLLANNPRPIPGGKD